MCTEEIFNKITTTRKNRQLAYKRRAWVSVHSRRGLNKLPASHIQYENAFKTCGLANALPQKFPIGWKPCPSFPYVLSRTWGGVREVINCVGVTVQWRQDLVPIWIFIPIILYPEGTHIRTETTKPALLLNTETLTTPLAARNRFICVSSTTSHRETWTPYFSTLFAAIEVNDTHLVVFNIYNRSNTEQIASNQSEIVWTSVDQ